MFDTPDIYDSSDDEENVVKNPYEGVEETKASEIKTDSILKRIKSIKTNNQILGRTAKSHQYLLKHPAVEGRKKPGGTNKSPSNFPAPLAAVKDILDAVPSKPREQKDFVSSIVPSFRGILWQPNTNAMDLFLFTRVNWCGEFNYSSKSFSMSKIDMSQHALAKFVSSKELMAGYQRYDLKILSTVSPNQLSENNEKLQAASTKLKSFFDYANAIKKPFSDWMKVFPKIRVAKQLLTKDRAGTERTLTLSEVLSYIYVNDYKAFKSVFENLDTTVDGLNNNDEGVPALKTFYATLNLTQKDLREGMPYLSEGQIPRHAILYSLGLKCYTDGIEIKPEALYQQDLTPKKSKMYLGKLLVTQNPHTLFQNKDKPVFVPDFDKDFGGGVIGKTIIGEKEIQHKGANLQGIIKKGVNTKLPKFHHLTAPARYKTKYGLDDRLFQEFKQAFEFLKTNTEYEKLSWMYLETVLLAHLIHFHEIQLVKYSNKIAHDSEKKIHWFNREDKPITNPFKK